ncbi:MAG: coenzyme F420-0:L-glutamate ligase [Candidatus Hecatellaceae archaeon]
MKGWVRLNHPLVERLCRVRTSYWLPGTDYALRVAEAVKGKASDGDVIAVSEKAVSTAMNLTVDEAGIRPGMPARMLASLWMRLGWGYLLGPLCRLKPQTFRRLRGYPREEGARHKQLALEKAGILQALKFGSEGGIDASNLPASYVSLPLPNPAYAARRIHEAVRSRLGVEACVLIVDSDKTYSLGCLHLSPTPTSLKGFKTGGGIFYYVLGRLFKLKPRSTPKACYPGGRLTVEECLELAELAHQAMSRGKPKNVWDMAESFGVGLTEVTWLMLKRMAHHPVVVLRLRKLVFRRGNFNM